LRKREWEQREPAPMLALEPIGPSCSHCSHWFRRVDVGRASSRSSRQVVDVVAVVAGIVGAVLSFDVR
jgi:hypothetical protein